MCLGLLLWALSLGGCASRSGGLVLPVEGKKYSRYFIFGFGYVEVPHAAREPAVVASAVRGVGVQISDVPGLRLGAGYYESSTILVGADAKDTLIEFSRPAGGGRRLALRRPCEGASGADDFSQHEN